MKRLISNYRLLLTLGIFSASSFHFSSPDSKFRFQLASKFFAGSSMAYAEDPVLPGDVIGSMMAQEFSLDMSKSTSSNRHKVHFHLKSRDEHLKELTDPNSNFDLLIIGGGASGAGVALEAASRGLKCAVVDAFDFSSGTSSRSTKMGHGGVRYFEQMMFLKDPVLNYRLLKETLYERNYFLQCAPYMNKELGLVIPSSSILWTALYYFPGMMLYHLIQLNQLANSNLMYSVSGPRILLNSTMKKRFPEIQAMHDKYGVLMYETQTIDTRQNINCLLTASIDDFIKGQKGATLANYMELRGLLKDANGKITGAVLFDKIKKKEYQVKSKVVVNCTGVHADEVRKIDNPNCESRITAARGSHFVFPKGLINDHQGVIIPKTSDGRLIYIINYLGHAMVGTTDDLCDVSHQVEALQQDRDFVVSEFKKILGPNYNYEENLLSSWAGIRPLVKALPTDDKEESEGEALREKTKNSITAVQWMGEHIGICLDWISKNILYRKQQGSTASFVRNHVIEVSDSGLVSLMGGKWTSFRKMGEETVNKILKLNKNLEPKYQESQTFNFAFIGSYSKVEAEFGLKEQASLTYQKYEDYMVFDYDLPREVAKHLVSMYGTQSLAILNQYPTGKEERKWSYQRLHPELPFINGEVVYAMRYELAQKPNDVICRRLPIAFVNQKVAHEVLEAVVEIMAKEKKWSGSQKKEELEEAKKLLQFMK